jgi:hypothetical protein
MPVAVLLQLAGSANAIGSIIGSVGTVSSRWQQYMANFGSGASGVYRGLLKQ